MSKFRNLAAAIDRIPFADLMVVRKDQGEKVESLGTPFTWKVKGADTGYTFVVYEMTLPPKALLPMHVHPFAEFYYVLEGTIDLRVDASNGAVTHLSLATGDGVNAPTNSPHSIENRSDQPARFLSTASFQHEAFADDLAAAAATTAFAALSEPEQTHVLVERAAKRQTFLVQPRVARERTDVEAVCDRMRSAWADGDAAAFAATFSADAHFIAFDGTTLRGPAQIAAFHTGPFKTYLASTDLVLEVQEIQELGETAAIVISKGGISRNGDRQGELIGESAQMFTIAWTDVGAQVRTFQNTRVRPIDGPITADIWKQFDRAWSERKVA